LEMYLNNLADCGFIVDRFIEPMPNKEIQQEYPEKWEFPRFVGIRCTKNSG